MNTTNVSIDLQMYLKIIRFSFCALLLLRGQQVQADGAHPSAHGEEGVNRRVKTIASSYVQVEGKWKEPNSFVPDEDRPPVAAPPEAGLPGIPASVANSIPSFYFGSTTVIPGRKDEIDAGAQYEHKTDNTTSAQDPGWAIFMSWNGAFTNYKRSLNSPYGTRFDKGELGPEINMTYRILADGTAQISLSNLNTHDPADSSISVCWNGARGFSKGHDQSQPVFQVANHSITKLSVTNTSVKRVVAMTQRRDAAAGAKFQGIFIDNSYIKDCAFTAGKIYKAKLNPDGTLAVNGLDIEMVEQAGGWPVASLDTTQTGTGYNTQNWAYDKSITTLADKRRWIVDFDFNGIVIPKDAAGRELRGPRNDTDTGDYRNPAVPKRYTDEVVHIHLQDGAARIAGRTLRSARVRP